MSKRVRTGGSQELEDEDETFAGSGSSGSSSDSQSDSALEPGAEADKSEADTFAKKVAHEKHLEELIERARVCGAFGEPNKLKKLKEWADKSKSWRMSGQSGRTAVPLLEVYNAFRLVFLTKSMDAFYVYHRELTILPGDRKPSYIQFNVDSLRTVGLSALFKAFIAQATVDKDVMLSVDLFSPVPSRSEFLDDFRDANPALAYNRRVVGIRIGQVAWIVEAAGDSSPLMAALFIGATRDGKSFCFSTLVSHSLHFFDVYSGLYYLTDKMPDNYKWQRKSEQMLEENHLFDPSVLKRGGDGKRKDGKSEAPSPSPHSAGAKAEIHSRHGSSSPERMCDELVKKGSRTSLKPGFERRSHSTVSSTSSLGSSSSSPGAKRHPRMHPMVTPTGVRLLPMDAAMVALPEVREIQAKRAKVLREFEAGRLERQALYHYQCASRMKSNFSLLKRTHEEKRQLEKQMLQSQCDEIKKARDDLIRAGELVVKSSKPAEFGVIVSRLESTLHMYRTISDADISKVAEKGRREFGQWMDRITREHEIAKRLIQQLRQLISEMASLETERKEWIHKEMNEVRALYGQMHAQMFSHDLTAKVTAAESISAMTSQLQLEYRRYEGAREEALRLQREHEQSVIEIAGYKRIADGIDRQKKKLQKLQRAEHGAIKKMLLQAKEVFGRGEGFGTGPQFEEAVGERLMDRFLELKRKEHQVFALGQVLQLESDMATDDRRLLEFEKQSLLSWSHRVEHEKQVLDYRSLQLDAAEAKVRGRITRLEAFETDGDFATARKVLYKERFEEDSGKLKAELKARDQSIMKLRSELSDSRLEVIKERESATRARMEMMEKVSSVSSSMASATVDRKALSQLRAESDKLLLEKERRIEEYRERIAELQSSVKAASDRYDDMSVRNGILEDDCVQLKSDMKKQVNAINAMKRMMAKVREAVPPTVQDLVTAVIHMQQVTWADLEWEHSVREHIDSVATLFGPGYIDVEHYYKTAEDILQKVGNVMVVPSKASTLGGGMSMHAAMDSISSLGADSDGLSMANLKQSQLQINSLLDKLYDTGIADDDSGALGAHVSGAKTTTFLGTLAHKLYGDTDAAALGVVQESDDDLEEALSGDRTETVSTTTSSSKKKGKRSKKKKKAAKSKKKKKKKHSRSKTTATSKRGIKLKPVSVSAGTKRRGSLERDDYSSSEHSPIGGRSKMEGSPDSLEFALINDSTPTPGMTPELSTSSSDRMYSGRVERDSRGAVRRMTLPPEYSRDRLAEGRKGARFSDRMAQRKSERLWDTRSESEEQSPVTGEVFDSYEVKDEFAVVRGGGRRRKSRTPKAGEIGEDIGHKRKGSATHRARATTPGHMKAEPSYLRRADTGTSEDLLDDCFSYLKDTMPEVTTAARKVRQQRIDELRHAGHDTSDLGFDGLLAKKAAAESGSAPKRKERKRKKKKKR